MDIYGTKQIRNVVLLGHGGAGKTTVAEALAYLTGVTKRMGKVADGNTISDYDKEEIKRQFSISTTMVPIEYEGAEGKIKINLLDTPGYFDFVGEVEEAVSAADAAIIVVNCKAGIEVGTEKAWDLCEEYKLPRIIFVTNMDDDHASFRELILKLEKKFGRKIAPFQVPIRENEKFVGFVNAVKMQGRRFTNLSDYEDCEIPEYTKKNLGIIRDALIEAVAETSEEYMERYFSGEEFTQDEIYTAVQTHVCDGSIVPVMMGSGTNCQGFNALLNAIDRYFPSPDKGECVGVDVSNGEHFTAKYNDEVSLSARVFKTIVDPFIGKYSLMKVCTGTLKPDSTLYNVNKDTEEKIAKVYVLRGKDVIEVPERKQQLNQNLMLFFTGFSRFSSDIQQTTEKALVDKQKQLLEMLSLVDDAEKVLTSKTDLNEFGRLLDYTWKLKRGISNRISTDSIDGLYAKGMAAGALGGKLLGAGGGGFLLFYVEPDKQEAVHKAMEELLYVPFEFENSGTRVIHYTPETYEKR